MLYFFIQVHFAPHTSHAKNGFLFCEKIYRCSLVNTETGLGLNRLVMLSMAMNVGY